jgi:light-regulated signal transduction histidine kinase (bacteriophytochrome)
LRQFERGETEVFEKTLINGEPYIRLMSALVADEYCLKCHSEQGYRVGDVLGGVGVSVSLQSYLEGAARVDPEKILLLAVIWIMGLAAIYAIGLLIRRRVEERMLNEAALIRKNREIISANAYLTRFAEISAHHLMEPTRRLVSYSQRLQGHLKTMPDAHNDEVYQDLQVLERDAAHLRMLVKDIQLFLAAGEPVEKVGIQDVDALLSNLLQRLESRVKRANVRLHIDKLPPATLDKSRLTDLFWILMDNALSHGLPADDDAVPEIHISGERVGKLSRYRISDNGPGIPVQYRERVFEIFERLTTTDKPAGAGIGLPIARRIVESRHGKIELEDSPLGGISVVFELPDDN